MTVQWYPHHMKQAKEELADKLDLIDVVVEMVDARIPKSSRNNELDELLADKKKVVVLNKKDLADPESTAKWLGFFRAEVPAVAVNALQGHGIEKLLEKIKELMETEKEKLKRQGRRKDTRLMIVGIPNVGKSQLINKLGGRSKTQTGNKPGVTRNQQWVKLKSGFQLLDTPGILWPNFDSKEVGKKLGICGAIKEGNYNLEVLAYELIKILQELSPAKLQERFKLNEADLNLATYDLMAEMGRKRGCLQSGGKIDRDRLSRIVIQEFRAGKLGRLTLELP